jgi:hypothetical protein
MKKTTETYYCDMCGKEIDTSVDSPHRSIICSGCMSMSIPVYMHNRTYDEGYQDCLAWESVDLCPECTDRACAIHVEVYKEDGEWHSKLSWRDTLERQDEAEMSESAKRIFNRLMESANKESEFERLKKNAEGKDSG